MIPGSAQVGERLRQTALRDFAPPTDNAGDNVQIYRLQLSSRDAPVPRLMMYALDLVGLSARGPSEKVAWWTDFNYQGQRCQLAHQKFGLRLYLQTELPGPDAEKTLRQIAKQLRSSTRAVEKLLLASAPDLLREGAATVVNQHRTLRRAYAYFRARAVDPASVPDKYDVEKSKDGAVTASSFTSGAILMRMNAFHDLVAAITAYLSLLEHDLVLALAFTGFNPQKDLLTDFIGWRWGLKFRRVLGTDGEAARYLDRLSAVVERWRNPYAHGGFEKGQGATVYLHAPSVGAVPVGLTAVRDSPLFSLLPANDTDITQVFQLFDEIDEWAKSVMPDAVRWIESGLNVRFDESFRSSLASALATGTFDDYLRRAEYHQAMVDNMDY